MMRLDFGASPVTRRIVSPSNGTARAMSAAALRSCAQIATDTGSSIWSSSPSAAARRDHGTLTLRTSLRATEDALRTDASEDPSLRESVALFERLKAHGQELDAELKSLENEPDQAMLAQRLPALRERTRRITRSADSLRWAARDRARHFARAIGLVAPTTLPRAAASALWVVAAALSTLAGPAAATDFGHHPAATAPRHAAAGIDVSTFIPGHPARGAAGRAEHANFEHPALATHRAGQQPRINPDTFIVQPPATTAWIVVAPPMWAAVQAR